jgi:hypothetical protein
VAAGGGHSIDVLTVGLEVEPASVGRIEHMPNSVAAFCQPFGLAPCRRNPPELHVSTGVGGVNEPAAIRRPASIKLIVRRKGELACLASADIKTE